MRRRGARGSRDSPLTKARKSTTGGINTNAASSNRPLVLLVTCQKCVPAHSFDSATRLERKHASHQIVAKNLSASCMTYCTRTLCSNTNIGSAT